MHRETYYLAVDIFDRFMDIRSNVKKDQLQLLGVTCLFVAAKIEVGRKCCVYSAVDDIYENLAIFKKNIIYHGFFPFQEIYPPQAAEFAYVTDGACSVSDLLDTELVICKVCFTTESVTHTLPGPCVCDAGVTVNDVGGLILSDSHGRFSGLVNYIKSAEVFSYSGLV